MSTEDRAFQPELLMQLRVDHVNIAVLLDLVEDELERFDTGMDPDYGLLFDIVHYLCNFPDAIHHPNEDLLFQRLIDRDHDVRVVIERLFEEHEALAAAGRNVQAMLEQIVDDQIIARDEVHQQIEKYLRFFRDYMGREEGEVFPAAERCLGARDWLALNAEFAERTDPLFGDIIAHEYQAIAERLREADS